MALKKRDFIFFFTICLLLLGAMVLHLFSGQLKLSWSEFFDSMFHFDVKNTQQLIAREFRIPRLVIAMVAGAALAVSGMLMQTLFNNPLAGPYVLGINSGSSLLVALSLLTGFSFFQSDIGLIASALFGALIFGFLLLGLSMYIKSSISLLLIGLMLGSFTGAIITALQAVSSAQELKAFTIWTMGSLQQTQFDQLPVILLFFVLGISMCFFLVKPLDVLVIGEKNTEILGLNIKRIRVLTITVTAILTGLTTAFCGPIAFVGMAVPNVTRILLKTQSHGKLLLANLLFGALFLVLADSSIQLLESILPLPINAFTSLIGAPLIILIVLKRLK